MAYTPGYIPGLYADGNLPGGKVKNSNGVEFVTGDTGGSAANYSHITADSITLDGFGSGFGDDSSIKMSQGMRIGNAASSMFFQVATSADDFVFGRPNGFSFAKISAGGDAVFKNVEPWAANLYTSGTALKPWSESHATEFHGGGSNLTGIVASVDESGDFDWTGSHSFSQTIETGPGASLEIYNVNDGANDYERIAVKWSSNTAHISAESNGSGVARGMAFQTGGFTRFGINSGGSMYVSKTFYATNGADLGFSTLPWGAVYASSINAASVVLDGTSTTMAIVKRSGTAYYTFGSTAYYCAFSRSLGTSSARWGGIFGTSLNVSGGIGLFGATAPASQPAAPTTLAEVITILQDAGLCG